MSALWNSISGDTKIFIIIVIGAALLYLYSEGLKFLETTKNASLKHFYNTIIYPRESAFHLAMVIGSVLLFITEVVVIIRMVIKLF